jgi:Na+/H+-dicarboxylate symporter
MKKSSLFENYKGIIYLLTGIAIGSIIGLILKEKVEYIKPIGDIFLNLIFTSVVPLIFFAIASAFANLQSSQKFGKMIRIMLLVFLSTLIISAAFTILALSIFPMSGDIPLAEALTEKMEAKSFGQQLTELLTVDDFFRLLSRRSMLGLIIFSILIGLATSHSGKAGESFHRFLNSGNEVMKKMLSYIMMLAPFGLGAYFAYQVGVFGPQLFGTYASAMAVCYGVCLFYFIFMFSLYVFIARGPNGIKQYWTNNIIPSATALGTCSSIATIPANLEAAKKMGISDQVAEVVLPLGATLHKDGSSISSIVKIALVFAILQQPLLAWDTILIAIGVSVIISIVEGGIPNGGYAGELMVVAVYNFPIEVLPIVIIVGTLVDPVVTLVNATGDNYAAMLVERFTGKSQTSPQESR